MVGVKYIWSSKLDLLRRIPIYLGDYIKKQTRSTHISLTYGRYQLINQVNVCDHTVLERDIDKYVILNGSKGQWIYEGPTISLSRWTGGITSGGANLVLFWEWNVFYAIYFI